MREQLTGLWGMIAASILTSVAAQTCMKLGLNQADSINAASGLVGFALLIVRSPLVLVGLVLYGIGALTWIAALRRLNLSYAYPFLALNFVLIALVSYAVLGESIPPLRWLGIGCISVGIGFVAYSAL